MAAVFDPSRLPCHLPYSHGYDLRFLASLILWRLPIALTVVGLFLAWILLTQPLFSKINVALSASADPRALKVHVRTLASVLPPRNHDPNQLNIAAAYIFMVLESYGAPEYQEFDVPGASSRNVILRLSPETGPLLVIGAHYDVVGTLPGADDNASGVAGLLELARLLAHTPLHAPVELVAYALQEPPHFGTQHMGSYRHAARLKASGQPVTLMLSLEMIGYFRDEPDSQSYPLPGLGLIYPTTGNFIAAIGRLREMNAVRDIKRFFQVKTDLPIYSLTAPPLIPGVTLSDHRNYWSHGFKAVMITDTAYLRNPNYHTAADTPDTLDYARMAKVVDGIYAVVEGFSSP